MHQRHWTSLDPNASQKTGVGIDNKITRTFGMDIAILDASVKHHTTTNIIGAMKCCQIFVGKGLLQILASSTVL